MKQVALPEDVESILRDLNPWWESGRLRTAPPPYHRRGVDAIIHRLRQKSRLIEVIRGPRQVGKTTAIEQAVQHLLNSSVRPTDICYIRFDQEVLREHKGGFRSMAKWYQQTIRRRPFEDGLQCYLFLDEIHKLDNWDSEIKDFIDTYPVRIVLTGSSSVLIAKGGRESLAGRLIVSELPTFQFREVLEAWFPIAKQLPAPAIFEDIFTENLEEMFYPFRKLSGHQRRVLRGRLEAYYNRGGYPKLHNGEVPDDLWADYLTQTIFDRVLGVDVPDLFPVRNPRLLRWLYVEIARSTGQQIIQGRLTKDANAADFETSQPRVGMYVHYLADALLIREFRKYPTMTRANARALAKITLTDLGARNAIFRGAPSLWESPPDHVGNLVETLAQSVLRGHNLQFHYFRDYDNARRREGPIREVDFIVEDESGAVVPIEVKFRRTIDSADFTGLKHFMKRFPDTKHGIMVTRDTYSWIPDLRIMCVPLLEFLLAF